MTAIRTIGAATLILGDCLDHVPTLIAQAGILMTDPPYGNGYKVNARPRKCGTGLIAIEATATESKDAIHGDDREFDPRPWLMARRLAFFGANHFAHRLPRADRWVVWDKRGDMKPDDHSDGEMVWIKIGERKQQALRIHRQKWRGVVREGEENCSRSRKLHPNQKPVALLGYLLDLMGAQSDETVVDPYMGSGSTAVAALRMGCRFVGCEIDPAHYETACRRVAAEIAVAA